MYGDGKIYLASERGYVVVLSEEEHPEVLEINDLGHDILGTPAIAEGRLYIRARNKLVCAAELGE